MRYVSVFSGIEAASVAFDPLGWVPLAFCEVEPFACAVLAHRFPHVPNLGDMTKVAWCEWRGKCDLVVGGPPCQAFSVAGLRMSLADARGNLSLEYVRAIHAINPVWCITENVPGWLTTGDNAFGCFLAGLVGEAQPLVSGKGSWPDAGMAVGPDRAAAWRVLDAQHFGIPQSRRRVFVVSCRTGDGTNPGAVLFEPASLPWDSSACGTEGQGVGRVFPCLTRRGARSLREEEAYVVEPCGGIRHLVPREAERLQGFPPDWTLVPYRGKLAADGPRHKAIGNSTCTAVMRWLAQRIEIVREAQCA